MLGGEGWKANEIVGIEGESLWDWVCLWETYGQGG